MNGCLLPLRLSQVLCPAVLFLIVSLAPAAELPGAATANARTLTSQLPLAQYAIQDPVLHLTAWTFVAPVDWRRSGGVYWTGRLLPLAYYSELTITNPRGSEQLQLFPTAIYVAADNPLWAAGRPVSPYLQADECILRILIPKHRPQAKNVKVLASDNPSQLVSEASARSRTQGVAGCDVRAARVLVEYQEGDRSFHEMFFCTLVSPPKSQGPTVWCIDAIHTQRLNTPASDGWTRAYRNTERVANPTTGEEMDVSGGYLQYYQDYSGRIYGSNDPTDFYLQTKIGGTVLEPSR